MLIDEVEFLQLRECSHQAAEDIMDTFMVTEDAHGLIRLQDPCGAASFVQEVHQLSVTAEFESLGHRAF